MSTKRIQRKRTKGWKMPENTVYVGRPSVFGNPYQLQKSYSRRWIIGLIDDAEAIGCVESYRRYLLANQSGSERFRIPLGQLRGKNLACWCPLDKPCHADVLLEIANEQILSRSDETGAEQEKP